MPQPDPHHLGSPTPRKEPSMTIKLTGSRTLIGRRAVVGLVAATTLALAACGGGDTGASGGGGRKAGGTIKVGVQPVIAILPLYVGIKQGFFKEEGLDVQTVKAETGPALVTQTINGQMDLAFLGSPVLINAAANKLPLRYVTAVNTTVGPGGDAEESRILVSANSTLTKPSELVGKKVAVNSLESLLHTAARNAIDADGGDSSKVQYVEVPFTSMLATLRSGEVDAVVTAEPFVTQGLESKQTKSLSTMWDKLPADLPVSLFATSVKGSQNTARLDAFRKAWAKSVEYTKANPDEARKELASYTSIPANLTPKMNLSAWSPDMSSQKALDGLNQIADLEVKFGFIDKKPDLATVVK